LHFIVIGFPGPAAAQERVLVGTQRLAENGPLFFWRRRKATSKPKGSIWA
jgi:hypothetical protein